ncbi:FHA domain-containing protein [Candidatus Uabimicrobium sp. HlEnr_7]|uniref:FHA domain-containing protein n=1 Tax=Candidatus Uabimicrobium helgolandensis TaxID=3095367 RepID=UPI0035578DE3
MVVKKYVSGGIQLDQRAPDYAHEVMSLIPIIKNIFFAFHHEQSLYAIIANLDEEEASADLMVITRRGIGIIEFKGNYGVVRQGEKNNHWCAGKVIVKGGNNNKYGTPHKQVQAYAQKIRDVLISGENLERELPWKSFRFNTAVCFTHKKAKFHKFREWYAQKQDLLENWEQFHILSATEIPEWVASLRFEYKKNYSGGYQPYSLSNEEIEYIATKLFKTVEWSEIDQLMPDGQPYAYLSIMREGQAGNHGLKFDREVIGRSATNSDFIIPASFEKVSGKHLEITRTLAGIFVEDIGSKNGTYINGQMLTTKTLIEDQQKIYLGGTNPCESCILKFSLTPPDTSKTL